jgi:hypothetical protein
MIIKTFTYLHDTTAEIQTFYSEAVEVNPVNDIQENTQIKLEFWAEALAATVKVQITTDVVVSTATTWHDLESFSIASTTEKVFKTYNSISDFSNNVSWLRVTYIRADENTGKFDRVIVRM